MKISIAQFGLGPIGVECVRLASTYPWAECVAGVDIDPKKQGRTLTDIAGVEGLEGARVYASLEAMWEDGVRPHVVLHTAGSRAAESLQQMKPMVEAGVHVVSSCEELLFPALRAPAEAEMFDGLCREHKTRILGTGVNPGFVLDVLAVCMTGVCRKVHRVYGERVVNASERREPLQRKIGSGMEPDEFRRLFREGRAGHAGFQESLALIAHALGWNIGAIRETCEPVVADRDIQTEFFQVPKGRTRGLHQVVEAEDGEGRTITLDLQMVLDAEDPHDAISIEGAPPASLRIEGGIEGDHATVAAVVNAVPRLMKAPPGLLLMTDLPVPCCAEHASPNGAPTRVPAFSAGQAG